MENINAVRNLLFFFNLKLLLDSVSLRLEDTNILPIDLIYLMDEEKAAVTVSLENILPLDDRCERITSPEGIHRADLTEEIEKAEQSPLGSNILPISSRGNGLLPTP